MSETPDEPDLGLSHLQAALVEFTGCIGSALANICSYGLTIGESYVPFDPDPEDECEDEEAMCSQVWVRVASTDVTNVTSGFEAGGCGGSMAVVLEVGVKRCIAIAEGGEAPTTSEVLVAALQAMDDMQKLYCAAMGCKVWDGITVGQWVPFGPAGGEYGGTWNFTVEID